MTKSTKVLLLILGILALALGVVLISKNGGIAPVAASNTLEKKIESRFDRISGVRYEDYAQFIKDDLGSIYKENALLPIGPVPAGRANPFSPCSVDNPCSKNN